MERIKVEGFNVEIREEKDFFTALVVELPDCGCKGRTRDEVIKKIGRGIRKYLVAWAKERREKLERKKAVDAEPRRKRKGKKERTK